MQELPSQTKINYDTYKRLANFPTLAEDLAAVISKPPFPYGYQPETIEIFFDEIPVYTWMNGETVLDVPVDQNTEPDAVEIGIDGELGFVILGDQLILNRIKNLALYDELMRAYASNRSG
jgi:hypothetical protein